jgi:hypothetical protein
MPTQMLGRPILRKQVSGCLMRGCSSRINLILCLDQLRHVSAFSNSVGQYHLRFAILCKQSFLVQPGRLLPIGHASFSWSVLHFPLVQLHHLPCHARFLPHIRSIMREFRLGFPPGSLLHPYFVSHLIPFFFFFVSGDLSDDILAFNLQDTSSQSLV